MSRQDFSGLQLACINAGMGFRAYWNAQSQSGYLEIPYIAGIHSEEFTKLVGLSEFGEVKIEGVDGPSEEVLVIIQ